MQNKLHRNRQLILFDTTEQPIKTVNLQQQRRKSSMRLFDIETFHIFPYSVIIHYGNPKDQVEQLRCI